MLKRCLLVIKQHRNIVYHKNNSCYCIKAVCKLASNICNINVLLPIMSIGTNMENTTNSSKMFKENINKYIKITNIQYVLQ